MKKSQGVVEANGRLGKTDARTAISSRPFEVDVEIQGVVPILFHRWDCDAVEAKAQAKKGSREKKTDNVESYVYRCEDRTLGVPATNVHAALVHAAKSKSDPRSPRKSAKELIEAVLLVTPPMISFGRDKWDYEDKRRAVIHRQGAVNRVRPALREGWKLRFTIAVLDASYVDETFLHDLIDYAGKYSGLCDFRPPFGRFTVTRYEVRGESNAIHG